MILLLCYSCPFLFWTCILEILQTAQPTRALKGLPPLIWFYVSLWAGDFFYKLLQVAYICTIAKDCVIRTQNKSFGSVFYTVKNIIS